MDSLSDYEAWKNKQQENNVGAASVVLSSAADTPDQAASDFKLANDFGKVTGNPVPPQPLVKEFRNVFQQKIEEAKNKTILASSPRLTEWLRNPDNASVARDDLSNLSWFEGFGRGAVASGERGVLGLRQAGNQFMLEQAAGRARDRGLSFGQMVDEERLSNGFTDASGQPIKSWDGSEWLRAGARWLDARYADMIGTNDEDAAKQFAGNIADLQQRIANTPKSVSAQQFEEQAMKSDAKTFGESVLNFGQAMLHNPIGALSWGLETAGDSAPQMAAALGATAITRNPAVGAAVAGAGAYATERYMSPADFLREKGVDLSKPDQVGKLLSDPKMLNEAAHRGVVRGAIMGIFGTLAGGVGGVEMARNPLFDKLAQGLTQAVIGGTQELAAEKATGEAPDWNKIIASGLGQMALTPAELLIAGRSVIGDRMKFARAEEARAQMEGVSQQAASSALRNRSPEKFREMVANGLEGSPVENVYVPADQFNEYFQSRGFDPYEVIGELDGVTRDDFETALAGGGDLQIPTATYAAKLAGTEHDAFLLDNMRFDPNEFTAREAAEFNAKSQDLMQSAWDMAEATRVEQELTRSHEQEIYDTMVSRLREAGRSTDVATNEAMLYPAFYKATAERSGMTVDELLRRYPLPEVKGSLPEGIQTKNVDALNRTLAEARNRRAVGLEKKGPTLLEFISDYGGINDAGGELKARDAEIVRRGKGKKSLKLARSGVAAGMRDLLGGGSGKKFGADDVARAAIEAGYLHDNPIANEYRHAMETGGQVPDISRALFEGIDAELRGTPQHAEGAAHGADTQNQALDSIEEYLSSLGVSLENTDDEIRTAIDGARQYAQENRPLLFQRNEAGARGSIMLPKGGIGSGDTIIRLFENANLSTMLHETGHYFLTVMQDMSERGEPGSVSEFDAVKSWWRDNAADVAADARRVMPDVAVTKDDVIRALDGGSSGDIMKDAAIDVGMQEQFARGFEAYLMEGKAPSVELRGAFEKFRAWLVSIYQRLAGLNVKMNDGIRQVMDRMIATDNEIGKAKDEVGDTGPLFADAEQMGLTPEQYDAFLKLRSQAEDEAKARLLRETMAPIKREKEKAYREEKARVRDEVTNEVNAYRHYRALEWMGNRRWLGEGKPEDLPDVRMSKEMLVNQYGAGVLETLPRGRQTVYTVDETGVSPDEAAGWFGYESGDEMIRAMERAPKRTEAIDAETERVMRDRHGDPLNDGSIEAEALDAVHTDKKAQWLAAELKAVIDVAGTGVGLTAKEARATARDAVSRMRVRDAMNANRFLAAERKAAGEAANLGAILAREGVWMNNARRRIATKARDAVRGEGTANAVAPQIDRANASTGNYNDTVAKLIDAKKRQLINHAFYMEARKIADEVGKAENYVAKLGKAGVRERIAGAGRRENANIDYLGAIDELLDQYDFRRLSNAAEQRRGALNAFIQRMRDTGRENELSIPETVLADAARKPYKTIPVEELRGVVDSLKNLEHIALRWDKLIDAQNERIFSETVDGIAAAIDQNLPKRPPGPVKTKGEALRNTARAYLDSVLNATTLLREIDGFKDQGDAYQGIKAPIDEAQNRLIVRKKDAAEKLEKLYSVYTKEERRAMATRTFMPELNMSLSKWERIAIALNSGNEGNLSRLTDSGARRSFTLDQVKAVLDTLDARDADFIQSVWDYIGSFKNDIAARERRVTGIEPEWVDASPVTIGGKELKGGYYPIKYDTRLSSVAADRETVDIAQSLASGRFGKAQTRNGHLKERAAAGDGSIDLDMAVMHKHVNQVMYDLEMSEPVANAWRILQDGRVRSALDDAGRSADFDALQSWLKDAAEGELGATSIIGTVARAAKSNFTAAKLAFNISNALLQFSGVAQSFVVVGKKDMAIGIMKTARNPFAMARNVAEKSPFMATRQSTFNKDIMDFYQQPGQNFASSRWQDFKKDIFVPVAFTLMQKMQWHFADVPTWVAGYEQGLRKFGGNEARAIAHADDLVKRGQASGLFIDRAGLERGSLSSTSRQNEFIKLFSTLGSYMFAKFNAAYERSAKAGRVLDQEGFSIRSAGEVASWTVDMVFLFTLEGLVTAAIKGQLPSQNDDDGKQDGWIAFLAKQTAFSALGTLPFIRDGVSALQGHDGGGAYGSIMGDSAKGLMSSGKLAMALMSDEQDVKVSDIKNVINSTGLFTGLPTVAINRIVDAGWRQSEVGDVSPLEYIFGRMGNTKR